ncbi:MAG: hypothetical protein J0L92_19895 [Deltaproteobacteria bacterium]|nr:hypothetical protein [Deltaproteobacteria bacterium]
MPSRLFLSQSMLDRWLSDGTADVSGDTLTILAAEHKFDLKTAVLFEKEVTDSNDKHALIGRVKDVDQIAEMGGDYSVGTVIVGDEAYEVTDGFAGIAVQGDLQPALASLAPPPPSTGRTTDPDLVTAAGTSSPGALDATAAGATSPGETSPGATSPGDLASAIGAATPGGAPAKENELDLLARFFLEKR